jgi:hypothetical protein
MSTARGRPPSWAGAAGISGARIVHGASVREEDETLKLRFLSTFRGNQQPLFLTATSEEDGALIFRVPQPGVLEVHVKPQAETLTIKILLRANRTWRSILSNGRRGTGQR